MYTDITIALVVLDTGAPTATDSYIKTWLEALTYVTSVTYQDVNTVTQATLNGYNLVIASTSACGHADVVICKGLEVPLIFISHDAYDELSFGSGTAQDAAEDSIELTDVSHHITSGRDSTGTNMAVGNIQVVTNNMVLSYITGNSNDVTDIAEDIDTPASKAILYLDKTKLHVDGTRAIKRIAFLGFLENVDSTDTIHADGEILFDRTIQWVLEWRGLEWSTDAVAALRAGCPVEYLVYIDVVDSGGDYGNYMHDITNRVMGIGPIRRSSTIIEKNFKTYPNTVIVKNEDKYFTAEWYYGDRAGLANTIWKDRDAGEADPEDCKIKINMRLTLPDRTTETMPLYEGRITLVNYIQSKRESICEIVSRDDAFDDLDYEFDYADGKEYVGGA